MPLESSQVVASVVAVVLASLAAGVLMIGPRRLRRAAFGALCACAVLATASWFRFGAFHTLYFDAAPAESGPARAKVERHLPLHFHELFHYYLGAKYFSELGYLGLYDCVTLADRAIAEEDQTAPVVTGWVRRLDDVLSDETHDAAMAGCRTTWRPRFTDARWHAFEDDVRALRRLVRDDAWNEVVFDAGFNPPPSTVFLYAAVANAVPVGSGPFPAILLATSLDLILLLFSYVALRRAFGASTAAVAAVFFGASFLAGYGWLGGALLRFLWVAALVASLAAMKRGSWALAGSMLALATCDRVFPFAFALGAAIPLVAAVRRDSRAPERRQLARFACAMAVTTAALVLAGGVAYGWRAWPLFFARTLQYGNVYYVMHVGLAKVLTFRSWVPHHDFHGHLGLIAFRDWNMRLRETWSAVRPVAVAVQAAAAIGTTVACARRRPYEAAVLAGVVFMFTFNQPASYYYVVLCLVPAVLFRSAARSRRGAVQAGDLVALGMFAAFTLVTLLSPSEWGDDIVFDFVICVAFATFLVVWMAAWVRSAPVSTGLRAG